MVGSGKESHRHQRGSVIPYGELPDDEAILNPNLDSKVRSLVVLQGGHNGFTEVHDGVEVELGSKDLGQRTCSEDLGQRTCSKDLDQRICSKKSIKALGP